MKLTHPKRPDEHVIIGQTKTWRHLFFSNSKHLYKPDNPKKYLTNLLCCGWRKA